jgi:hypothetical protein
MTTPLLKCPVSACSGLVARVEVPADHVGEDAREVEGAADLCGYCGSVWKSRAALETEIRASVARFPYRSAWYILTESSVRAAPEPVPDEDSLFERVENEPDDPVKVFVRD